MSAKPEVEKAVEWYHEKRGIFEALAKRVESIIREVLDERKINYYSISSRAKSIESYEAKASKEKYKDPLSEIEDMAGVRVITYTDADAKTVSQIVQELFEIQPEHAVDKAEELGTDRVGYRSIHCVGTLGDERVRLPENKIFNGMYFEVQVRTILQHAWAEFEHDRNYKFAGILPKEIRRRLLIAAANLESVDREFDSLSQAIDSYSLEVKGKTEAGNLQISIDSTSLKTYLGTKFESLIKLGLEPTFRGNDGEVIQELAGMNIKTIKDLDDIFPRDFIEKKSAQIKAEHPQCAYSGVLRELMMIHDVQAFIREARKTGRTSWPECGFRFLKEYGVDPAKYHFRAVEF